MDNGNSEERFENLPIPAGSKELTKQKGVRCTNCGKVFDSEKIFCPICGLRHTEDARLPSEISLIQPGLEHATRSSRIFALLSFILGVAGPLALGIGWLLAIIFGFTALNLIKIRGGFARDRKLALWGIILGFIWPVAIGFFVFFLYYHTATERRIQRNEVSIVTELQNIAVTQRYVKSGYFFDRDNDGESEYADTEDLSHIDYLYSDFSAASSEQHGYNIQIDVVKEKRFHVVARPMTYGTTGKKSFYIDESGILRGEDLRQIQSFGEWGTLPKVKSGSIFEEFDDEIAGDLLKLAKKLARERNFHRAGKILEEIKENYHMSPAVSDVSSVAKNISVYVAEDNARENYRRALKLMKDGEYRTALLILKDVEESYPDTLIIAEVKKDRAQVEETLAEELEQEAKQLFAEAENLELHGKYDEALSKYEKIVNELDSTSYFPRAEEFVPAVKRKREEKKAEALFAHLSTLKAAQEYTEIIDTIGVLTHRYCDTEFVKNKGKYLSSLATVALGCREKDRATMEFQKEHFQAAVQAGEEALCANPALGEDIKPILKASYIKLAETYFKTKQFEKAVPNYEKWIGLSPKEDLPEHKHYVESLYQLGKSAYLSGKHEEAKKNLVGLKRYFMKRDEFWYLLGSISIVEENYAEALNYFRRATRLNEQNFKACYKSGLCRLFLMQKSEEKLSGELKQLNSLKRGVDVVLETAVLVNGLDAKHIELGLWRRPKLLEGKTQLTPDQIKKEKVVPAERAKFVATMRTKLRTIEKQLRENEMARERVISTLKVTHSWISVGYRDLRKVSDSNTIPDLPRLMFPVYKKMTYFASARVQLKLGLGREKQLEQKTILCLKSALSAFGKKRSVSDYIEEMDSLYNPFLRARMNEGITKGNELLEKAISTKLPMGTYLAQLGLAQE